MPAPLNQEWLNQNAYRNYPFREDASLVTNESANVQLPNYMFVDFIMTVAGDTDIAVGLYRLSFVGNFLTCVFADEGGSTVATLTVDINSHAANDGYTLTGQDSYEDARGTVVLGELSRLAEDLPDGAYTFAHAWFEPCVIRPDIRGVRSLRVGFEDTLSDFIRGHIKLIEGTNIRLTYLPDINGIRIDAIDGAGFNQECVCTNDYTPPACIKYINGVNVEDVQIVGDGNCVEVRTEGNRIIIKDICSAPCCGCPELEFITDKLALQDSVLRRVEQYAEQLAAQITNTINAMLASTKGG